MQSNIKGVINNPAEFFSDLGHGLAENKYEILVSCLMLLRIFKEDFRSRRNNNVLRKKLQHHFKSPNLNVNPKIFKAM